MPNGIESGLDVSFQGIHIRLEGFATFFSNGARSERPLTFIALDDFDVSGLLQLGDLNTQVSSRGFRLLFEVGKLGFVRSHKQ